MSTYSDWIRWEASCHERPGSGITAGDTMHRQLGEYTSPRPCPNGLPIDSRRPGECQAWRDRIERAKRDISRHADACAMAEAYERAVVTFATGDVRELVQLTENIFNELSGGKTNGPNGSETRCD